MADSPYATLAGVLQADVTTLREAFFYHTSRYQCREGERKASSSPAPQRSVTFTPLPPELKTKLAQSGGSGEVWR